MKSRKTVNVEPTAAETDQPEAVNAMERIATPRRAEVRLGREVQHRIGQQLRSMYDEFVRQGVPPHIEELVRRLTEHNGGEEPSPPTVHDEQEDGAA